MLSTQQITTAKGGEQTIHQSTDAGNYARAMAIVTPYYSLMSAMANSNATV